jgi:putative transposase
MKASRFTEAQKAFVLKQGEAGTPVAEVCRKAGISQATYFNWKKKYGGLLPDEMRRLKVLEDENGRLKKIVADLTLDREMLQDVIRRKFLRAGARTGGAPALTLLGCASWFAGCASIGACRSAGLVGPCASAPRRFTTSPGAPTRLPSKGGSRRLRRRVCVTDIGACTGFFVGRAG